LRHEQVVVDQRFEGFRYLGVGAIFQGVAEVPAVDLAVPEVGAETRVEDARGGGEGEGPYLRLVPEVADPDGVLRARRARRARS
jgi:hypothetical protein